MANGRTVPSLRFPFSRLGNHFDRAGAVRGISVEVARVGEKCRVPKVGDDLFSWVRDGGVWVPLLENQIVRFVIIDGFLRSLFNTKQRNLFIPA